jgi:hypothetical protein
MDTNSLRIQASSWLMSNILQHIDGFRYFGIYPCARRAGATNDLLQVANNMADYLPAAKLSPISSASLSYELVFNTPGDLARFMNKLQQSPYGS